MRFNPIAREIICKVVYYGPGLAGKTSNMQWVRDHVPADQVSDLVSVDTHSERTLHFDWLALELGQIQGVNVRFEYFTVPGQNYYAATRRQVLQGADGVVFVADSRREALDENIDSMNEMLNNLRHHGLPDDLPVVMQYNKQDLPTALRREQLEPLMNVRGWPSFAATATAGVGVIETARAIAGLVAERLQREEIPALKEQGPAPAQAQSWLISCWRCQTILEVPTADPGSVYTCGVCGSTLEVIDSERGLTRAPAAAHDDSGGYQMHGSLVPDAGVSALAGTRPQPIERPVAVGDPSGFELDGYDLIATLDESVQGRRLRVRERSTGRNLRALSLAATLLRQPGYRDNLEPYVRMAGPIKHPNVLPLINLRPTAEGAVLFSVDPPDHEPLAHVLARRRALAPPHAMGLLRQISLALEESARHGVVHGWLRPDVVLVSPDGSVLIDELCVPKNHRYLVRELSGASAATEYYLAPEHLGEETRSDLRSDIFSLGALLFRMITGEGLVTGYSAHEALHKVVANGPRPLRSTQAGVSRDLDLFYQRLVATERKDRFQSYREVIEALDRFGGGAKRQTLKLTGTAAISAGAAARGVRGSAGAHIARRASGGSGNYAGRPRPAGGSPSTGSIRKKNDMTAMVVVIVLVVAVLAVGLIVVLTQQHAPLPVPADSSRGSASNSGWANPTVNTSTPTSLVSSTSGAGSGGSGGGVSSSPASSIATGGTGGVGTSVGNDAPAPMLRADLLHRVADLRTEERYQEALDLSSHLENATDRAQMRDQILGEHDQRRSEIEKEAAKSLHLEDVRHLVQPALATWGMPGDADWANAILTQAQNRLAGVQDPGSTAADPGSTAAATSPADGPRSPITGEPIHPATGNPDTSTPAAAGPVIAPVTDAGVELSETVDDALSKDSPIAARQALSGQDQGALEVQALAKEIDWWQRRHLVVKRAAKSGKVVMRLPNPTAGSAELWDVKDADPDSLTIASPAGAASVLPWTQFAPKDIMVVVRAAADAADATGEDVAVAVVMCLLANEPTLAALEVRTHKALIDNELGAQLEALVNLHRRRDLTPLLQQANEAVRTGNLHSLQEADAQLHRVDRAVLGPLAKQLAVLDKACKLLAERSSASLTGDHTAKDQLTFDTLDDLQSFSDSKGRWRQDQGMITNVDPTCVLVRSDLNNGKSLTIRFVPNSNKGTFAIDFRGATVLLDFAASTYLIGHDRHGHGLALIPKVSYTLYLERKDDTHAMLQINNGDSIEVLIQDLSDTMTLTVDNGASVSLDELTIRRDSNGPSMAEKQKMLKALGWDYIANAYLEAPAIVLPATPGVQSGIATPLRDNIQGYTLDAKGSGRLLFRLVRRDPGREETFIEEAVDLPKNPQELMTIEVRWSDRGVALYDNRGNEIPGSSKPLADHYTHLYILASDHATIASTPKVNYHSP